MLISDSASTNSECGYRAWFTLAFQQLEYFIFQRNLITDRRNNNLFLHLNDCSKISRKQEYPA